MSSETRDFKLQIFTPEKAEVYFSCVSWGTDAARVVKEMDEACIRVIGDAPGLPYDLERIRRIMSTCSGFVSVLPFRSSEGCTTDSFLARDLHIAADLGLPLFIFKEKGIVLEMSKKNDVVLLQLGSSEQFATATSQLHGPVVYNNSLNCRLDDLFNGFLAEVCKPTDRIKPYAFYIGRLERDFTQAREAIRTAVENEVGIPLLWADDGRHKTNCESLRQRTQLLLKHASFVIADLTLGIESPDRENPSRAHEIGMAIAYDRNLLLLSQEPRRYPYFSISDLQMIFWSTEADLECKVRRWLQNRRDCLGQSVWNHRLKEIGYEPHIAPLRFGFNPKERYIGPKTPRSAWIRRVARRLT